MNDEIIKYLSKEGFSVRTIDYKAIGDKYRNDKVHFAMFRDYKNFLFLEWDSKANYPSLSLYYGYNFSTEETRFLISIIYVGKDLRNLKKGFKKAYIEKYGLFKWVIRPIMKYFFKYIKVKDTEIIGYANGFTILK